LEPGQTVRWRSRRWRVLGEEEGGFLRLAGIENLNRDQEALALLELELGRIEPDELPLPKLDVERSDRARWRALHESYRITMAGGREQLVGLDWGAVAVEPYQLVPLLRVARTLRTRLLIADDTGLGKTAEAGIILRWLAQRHQANRVLIVTRAAPEPNRWRDEMWTKFGFRFDVLESGSVFAERRRQAPNVNVFAQQNKLIVSMTLAARQAFLDELRQCPAPFDVVIVDEAHHLAESGTRAKRLAVLGRALERASKDGALLLLTATPHDGKTASFISLLRLLDAFVEIEEDTVSIDVASRLMVRRLKPEVTLAGGRKFKEPEIHVLSTLAEASLQEKAVEPILGEYKSWLDGEKQRFERQGARQKATGCEFLVGTLLKRYGSSVAALRATLRRRLGRPPADEDTDAAIPFVETDASDPEDEVLDPGAEAETPPPPISPGERKVAQRLLAAAEAVPPGKDAKLQALVKLLGGKIAGQKAVVFTEYRDTLRAAARRLDAEGVSYVIFHGGTPDAERDTAIHSFLTDPKIRVFLATDAASEGKNLQHGVHHLIHLDVPWNPNRYLQRNGRIDRYGQTETPHIWALVAADRKGNQGRPEYRALEIVIEKLQRIAKESGSVGRVLPNFTSGKVREVLAGGGTDVEGRVGRLMDDDDTRRASEDLTRLTIRNREELNSAERYVSELGTIDEFRDLLEPLLRTTFYGWDDGGALIDVGDDLVCVIIPRRLRDGLGAELPRATFSRKVAVASQEAGEEPIEFLTPAHPLIDATLRAIREDARDPDFPHRFDVSVDLNEGLVFSFVARYVDGESRTADERLLAVEMTLDGQASKDSKSDFTRLGISEKSFPGRPSTERIAAWRSRFEALANTARLEAEGRTAEHLGELVRIADELSGDERESLGRWKGEEKARIEKISFGAAARISFDQFEAYEERLQRLESEYMRRLDTLRDRSKIRLASLELLGGRLLVRAAH
jgi:superfamily II DNA or RNA helicase